jgi:hypothetical protein
MPAIASVWDDGSMGIGEGIANANQMKASPDLFDALTLAGSFIARFEGDELQEGIDGPDGLLAIVRAALARARGEKS